MYRPKHAITSRACHGTASLAHVCPLRRVSGNRPYATERASGEALRLALPRSADGDARGERARTAPCSVRCGVGKVNFGTLR